MQDGHIDVGDVLNVSLSPGFHPVRLRGHGTTQSYAKLSENVLAHALSKATPDNFTPNTSGSNGQLQHETQTVLRR